MGLVSAKEVAKAIKVDKFGFVGTSLGWALMKLLNITTINKIYDKHKHLKDLNFINALLDEFEVKFEIPERILKGFQKQEDLSRFQIILSEGLMEFFC